ncbi:unnamed protein product [Paramecium primaurelia]|uniref:Uncharacterized protein n=1 Tax=Paramecium primaurelia TaxID=5886 RepID=A0A8S1NLM8_PARPR|nr:unnamed protein product [Paramecium primaurelia]
MPNLVLISNLKSILILIPNHSNYSNFAEQWQEKITSLQQNIEEMQQQEENVKNTLQQAQSRIKNKKSYIDEQKMQQIETKTQDTIYVFQKTSINPLLIDSSKTLEFQTLINNIQKQPIATFLIDIRLNDRIQEFMIIQFFQNYCQLRINANFYQTTIELINQDITEEFQLNQIKKWVYFLKKDYCQIQNIVSNKFQIWKNGQYLSTNLSIIPIFYQQGMIFIRFIMD